MKESKKEENNNKMDVVKRRMEEWRRIDRK